VTIHIGNLSCVLHINVTSGKKPGAHFASLRDAPKIPVYPLPNPIQTSLSFMTWCDPCCVHCTYVFIFSNPVVRSFKKLLGKRFYSILWYLFAINFAQTCKVLKGSRISAYSTFHLSVVQFQAKSARCVSSWVLYESRCGLAKIQRVNCKTCVTFRWHVHIIHDLEPDDWSLAL